MTDEPVDTGGISALDEVLITQELTRRPARAPDHEAEARTLGMLARSLADAPSGVLQKVADAAMMLCRADSAAVGTVECGSDGASFRWHAVAGAFPSRLAERTPFDSSPAGVAVRSGEVQLFERAERHFPALRGAIPHFHESLVAPWRIEGTSAGTLWVLAYHSDRQFDAEDARLLASLADFASAAWQTVLALETRHRAVAESSSARSTLRSQLSLAEEGERRRLARDLHDEVGQHLTALGLGLQALSDVAPPGSDVDRRATQLRALTDTLGRELHALAVRLRPRALDDFGLEAALQSYAEEWARQSGIGIHVHARGPSTRLAPSAESAVYRIVQEALTNVARHSGATHAGVVLERRDGYIHLVVEDDGRGFDPERAALPLADRMLGLGLLGMRERTALVGGTMDIESAPGKGTTVFVRFPVDDTSATHLSSVVAQRLELRADV
jgi:signal transduction histidine kinase